MPTLELPPPLLLELLELDAVEAAAVTIMVWPALVMTDGLAEVVDEASEETAAEEPLLLPSGSPSPVR